MRLTKKKALEICKKLWIKMRDEKATNESAKQDILAQMGYPDMEWNCPCCEYSMQHGYKFCGKKCLLSNVWKDGCLKGDSPFISFFNNGTGTPAEAQRIIDGCNAALKKLQRRR